MGVLSLDLIKQKVCNAVVSAPDCKQGFPITGETLTPCTQPFSSSNKQVNSSENTQKMCLFRLFTGQLALYLSSVRSVNSSVNQTLKAR